MTSTTISTDITEIIKDTILHEYKVCSNKTGCCSIDFAMKNENPTFSCLVKVSIDASNQIRSIYSFYDYIGAGDQIHTILNVDFQKYPGSVSASVECFRRLGSIHLRFDLKEITQS